MSISAGGVPYHYGELVSITQDCGLVYFWFSGRDGVIRGVWMDMSDPSKARINLGENEIVLKRGAANDSSTRAVVVRPGGAALPPIGG